MKPADILMALLIAIGFTLFGETFGSLRLPGMLVRRPPPLAKTA